jgi:DNA-binding transcriptional ArsR family regulator
MVIPGWLWPDSGSGKGATHSSGEIIDASEIDTATDVFEVLSNTTRIEILTALYGRSEPVSYTELRDSTSVTDKGRFNYHLRQLDRLVRSRDGEYALTEYGEELIRSVLSEERLPPKE